MFLFPLIFFHINLTYKGIGFLTAALSVVSNIHFNISFDIKRANVKVWFAQFHELFSRNLIDNEINSPHFGTLHMIAK